MAIIDGVRSYLKTCPLLKGGKINVNYLEGEAVKYSIDVMTVDPVIKKYPDGGSQRQFLFTLASREQYDQEALANMDIARFYEDFAAWIEEQEANRNYPAIGAGCTPTHIGILTSGYLFSIDGRTARFQIQLKLVYNKERMTRSWEL